MLLLLVFVNELDEVEKEAILVKGKDTECTVGILRVFLKLVLAIFSSNEDDIFPIEPISEVFSLLV